MLRFFLGLFSGAVLSFVYVRYDVELPKWMQLPELLRENVALTASLNDLYDLSPTDDVRVRALEVYFQNRPKAAAQMDRANGYPFLKRLHRKISHMHAAFQGHRLQRPYEKKHRLFMRLQCRSDGGPCHKLAARIWLLPSAAWPPRRRGPTPCRSLFEGNSCSGCPKGLAAR